ncbi:hypothetical protein NEOLEDRAFT_1070879, partial [Neolentinus lepideus HHB14362 ss-1]
LGLYEDSDDGDHLQQHLNDPVDSDTDQNSEHNSLEVDSLPNILESISLADVSSLAERPLPRDAYINAHDQWFMHAVLLLIVYLQPASHVTYHACLLILFTMCCIFISMGAIEPDDLMPITYKSIIHGLALKDRFQIHLACTKCHCLFPANLPPEAKYPGCNIPLFMCRNASILERLKGQAPPRPPPARAVPLSLLSSFLVDFLADENIECICDQWIDLHHQPGKYQNMMDGQVPQTVKDHQKKPFFDPASLTQDSELELSLFSDLLIDYMCHISYQTKNLLIPLAIPGPKEPTGEQLQSYLKFIVDDLIKLYEEGICIKTAAHPEGMSKYCLILSKH